VYILTKNYNCISFCVLKWIWLVSKIDAGRLIAYLFYIFKKKNTNTTSVMVKIVIVIESSRRLWSKPTWWCILKFKQKKHHVGFGTKPMWCFFCFQFPAKSPRRLSGLNRRGGELHDVSCLTDVWFNVSWVNVGLGQRWWRPFFLLVKAFMSKYFVSTNAKHDNEDHSLLKFLWN